ncbi:MAG: DNA mismatch repair endonuclease MutL [Saprospiraceae bacterium]|nr:DNA mismatch repair endonuclease MutL [Saprospiraceae bacterium]
MADIIQLLPDSIANQIAAGEVIQRPASVVKELMENAIDAGADEIKLIIKDSGKTTIQVIDNGKGMSETDARMAFERHATSKIRTAHDLFQIKTMGFRGEALASIAAIAQVEVITRPHEQELGSHLVIEASNIKKQEFCQAVPGTTFTVKNLFYNVPARRKFLKSDPVELRHIMDEFHRMALANPDIFFSLHHNGNEIYHLPKGNLRQRVINIFGKSYNEKIVPVHEDTDHMSLQGFVGKPEAAKKTRGEQYIFVNKRFIKSNYLNHSIRSCYDELVNKEYYPFYIIFMEMDPARIDINVHPTKQEIKFEEERLVYNYLKVSIKHALGQYNVIPTIDFDIDYNLTSRKEATIPERPGHSGTLQTARTEFQRDNMRAWQSLYDGIETEQPTPVTVESKLSQQELGKDENVESRQSRPPYQIQQAYILSQIKSGFLLIDQQSAHERILYERYLKAIEQSGIPSQKQLFPEAIELNPARIETLKSITPQLNRLGFEIEPFGDNSYVIHGIPSVVESIDSGKVLIEQLLEQYENNMEFQLGIPENLARSLAYSTCIKRGKSMDEDEMFSLIDQLFACTVPYKSPSGRKCFISIDTEEIKKRFEE